jgi:hypothetical protein
VRNRFQLPDSLAACLEDVAGARQLGAVSQRGRADVSFPEVELGLQESVTLPLTSNCMQLPKSKMSIDRM